MKRHLEVKTIEHKGIEIAIAKPPKLVWDGCHKHFDIDDANTVYTHGGTLYNPADNYIDRPLLVHESIHAKQQNATDGGPDAWWKRYLEDPVFRVIQEAEAYGAQYVEYCALHRDRNQQARFLHFIVSALSSDMYRVNMSYSDAKKAIMDRAK